MAAVRAPGQATTSPTSSVQLLAFVLDGQHLALPLATVERVFPMVAVSPLPGAPAVALGAVNLRGRIIPVLDIRRRLDFPAREYGVTSHLVVVRTARRTLGLPVDRVLGLLEVPEEAVMPPERVLPGIPRIAGLVALPDGVLLIHDLDAFLSLDEERELSGALRGFVG
jgi:purine-binding chemotaxis protein CheW